tara:strand:+ start:2007 stop:2111 length:105 start_codon:yes stop_codon:yes gene_type:complete
MLPQELRIRLESRANKRDFMDSDYSLRKEESILT